MDAVTGGDKAYAEQLHRAAVPPPDDPDETVSAEDHHHHTMIKNIRNFVAALHSGGTRDTESQEALDAVIAAACCTENGSDLPPGYAKFVEDRIGTTKHVINKGKEIANGLMAIPADPPAGEEDDGLHPRHHFHCWQRPYRPWRRQYSSSPLIFV